MDKLKDGAEYSFRIKEDTPRGREYDEITTTDIVRNFNQLKDTTVSNEFIAYGPCIRNELPLPGRDTTRRRAAEMVAEVEQDKQVYDGRSRLARAGHIVGLDEGNESPPTDHEAS